MQLGLYSFVSTSSGCILLFPLRKGKFVWLARCTRCVPLQGYLSDPLPRKVSRLNKGANKVAVLLLPVYRKYDGEMLSLLSSIYKALDFTSHVTLKLWQTSIVWNTNELNKGLKTISKLL